MQVATWAVWRLAGLVFVGLLSVRWAPLRSAGGTVTPSPRALASCRFAPVAALLLAVASIGAPPSFAQSDDPPAGEAPPAEVVSILAGPVPPISKDACPESHPIKGNRAGRQANRPTDPIYHVPSSRWYDVTDPEECFATIEGAEAAGYRAPLR